jgi:hypothetical protein
MSIIPELSSQQGRKDDEPNKILGTKLVESRDLDGIKEVAANLSNPSRNIQIDCLGVMERVGLLTPELIEDYLDELITLAFSNDNRLVWQSLIIIAMIAEKKADQLITHLDQIKGLYDKGTVITRDNVIKILARIGAAKPDYARQVYPFLIEQLRICRSKSIPQYGESIQVMINSENQDVYLSVLRKRIHELTPAQQKRVDKILKKYIKTT